MTEPLKFVGRRKVTDLDRVMAFARMVYEDRSWQHALLPMWMHYASVGEYLYDKGAHYPTVYGGILQGLFRHTYATLKDLLVFGQDIKEFNTTVPRIIQGITMSASAVDPVRILVTCVERDIIPIETVYVYLGSIYVGIMRSARHVNGLHVKQLDDYEEQILMLSAKLNDSFLDDIAEDVEDSIFLARKKKETLILV